jgi:hypothetical protein
MRPMTAFRQPITPLALPRSTGAATVAGDDVVVVARSMFASRTKERKRDENREKIKGFSSFFFLAFCFFLRTNFSIDDGEEAFKNVSFSFAMPPSDRVVVDHFGFELLDLTPELARARKACHEEASKREAKTEWAAIDRDRTSLPSPSELKKLARKVSVGWHFFELQ